MLEIIAIIAFFSAAQGAMSTQIELFIHPGMIFGQFGEWLKKSEHERMSQGLNQIWWHKIIGGCVYCMNVWLAFASYWLCVWILGLSTSQVFIYYLPYVFLSGGFARIFKVVN